MSHTRKLSVEKDPANGLGAAGRRANTGLSLLLAGLSLAAPLAAQTINLSELGTSYPGFRIPGIKPGDRLGSAVSGIGDVNGDGLEDIVVAAYWASPGGETKAGESYVVFGKTDGTAVDLASLESSAAGFGIVGMYANDKAGMRISGVGDFNGDLIPDILLAAPIATRYATDRIGECYLVFGKASSQPVDLEAPGTGGFRIDGYTAPDEFGGSVSSAGDVNGDGLCDVIIGAPFADPGGHSDAGRSVVLFGRPGTANISITALGSGGFVINGATSGEWSGTSVGGAGDVNGDGLDDLIIGAPTPTVGAGSAYVVFGKTDFAAVDLAALGTSGFKMAGGTIRDAAGSSVSGAGDVNGDGLADVIVGANSADYLARENAGAAYVVFGRTDSLSIDLSALGTHGFSIFGGANLDLAGTAVSKAGDCNGDGLADVLVAAAAADVPGATNAGISYVVYGKADSSVVDLLALGSSGFQMNGVGAQELPRIDASAAGDVNGDGKPDLLIGAGRADPGGRLDAGESYVVFSPASLAPQATYRSYALAGNAPQSPVGGSADEYTPSSRCLIDFDAGDNGAGGPSQQVVTLTRGNSDLTNLPGPSAQVHWEVFSDRTGFSTATITFVYTNSEIGGVTESALRLYQAPTTSGPWTPLASTVHTGRNRITSSVEGFSHFAIVQDSGSTGVLWILN